MNNVNTVSFSGVLDQVRKPSFGNGEGKMPFARCQVVQTNTREHEGESKEFTQRVPVKIFGEEPVKALKAAIEAGADTVVTVTGRLGNEKTNEQRVYKKKGATEETRADLYEMIVIVDGKDKAHGIAVAGASKAKKAA